MHSSPLRSNGSSIRDMELCWFIQCQESYLVHRRHAHNMCWLDKCSFDSTLLLLCGLEQVIKALQRSVKIKMVIVNNILHHWRIKWDKAATVKMAQRDLGFSLFWVLVIGMRFLWGKKFEKQWRNMETNTYTVTIVSVGAVVAVGVGSKKWDRQWENGTSLKLIVSWGALALPWVYKEQQT